MRQIALFFEGGDYSGIVYAIIGIMIGPAVLFLIAGIICYASSKKKAAKILFILAGVYLLISFGTCGLMMLGAF